MASGRNFANEKKIMYDIRVPNLCVKNMQGREWGEIWRVGRMCLHGDSIELGWNAHIRDKSIKVSRVATSNSHINDHFLIYPFKVSSKFNPTMWIYPGAEFSSVDWDENAKEHPYTELARGGNGVGLPTPGKLFLALITMSWHDCIFFRHHMILANESVSENYTPSAQSFLNAREIIWSVLWAKPLKKGADPDHILFQSKG